MEDNSKSPNQTIDPESIILRSALEFITNGKASVCRLCIAPTNNEEVSFRISVTVQQSFFDESITFMDMLNELGVPNEPLMPQNLCTNCATYTINSYLYLKQWQHSTAKWHKIMDQLAKSLTQSEALDRNNHAAYLMMNEKENFVVTSFRKKPIVNKTLAMLKLRSLFKNKKVQKCRDRTIMCVECGVMCTSKRDLLSHKLRMHKGSTQHSRDFHSCKHCTKFFACESELDTHMARVHLPKTIQCPKCPKMFSTNRLLKAHSKMKHESYTCKHCKIVLNDYPALRRHIETHEVIKCPKCSKVLKSKNTVKEHLKICGKKRSDCLPTVYCDICNKGYAKKGSLKQHMKTDHGYGYSYPCEWCEKKFNAPSALKCHIVKHTGERNFYCEICGGQFVTQAALTYHLRLHTGEKPYACDVCGETFINASRRAEHKKKQHLAPQFECSICSVKFSLNRSLKKHMIRHNNPRSKMYLDSLPLC